MSLITKENYIQPKEILRLAEEYAAMPLSQKPQIYGAKNVYLASPFFSPEQIERLDAVKTILELNPTIGNIYLPGEHQNAHIFPELTMEERMETSEWKQATFESDMHQVKQADITVAVGNFDIENDNPRPDEGTVAEMMATYAYNHKLYIIDFLKNDEKLNLMLWGISEGSYVWGGEEIAKLATYDFINMPYILTNKPVF